MLDNTKIDVNPFDAIHQQSVHPSNALSKKKHSSLIQFTCESDCKLKAFIQSYVRPKSTLDYWHTIVRGRVHAVPTTVGQSISSLQPKLWQGKQSGPAGSDNSC